MKIVVLNSGSSSLKFDIFDAETLETLLEGIIEAIGENKPSKTKYKYQGKENKQEGNVKNHSIGFEKMVQIMTDTKIASDFQKEINKVIVLYTEALSLRDQR